MSSHSDRKSEQSKEHPVQKDQQSRTQHEKRTAQQQQSGVESGQSHQQRSGNQNGAGPEQQQATHSNPEKRRDKHPQTAAKGDDDLMSKPGKS